MIGCNVCSCLFDSALLLLKQKESSTTEFVHKSTLKSGNLIWFCRAVFSHIRFTECSKYFLYFEGLFLQEIEVYKRTVQKLLLNKDATLFYN